MSLGKPLDDNMSSEKIANLNKYMSIKGHDSQNTVYGFFGPFRFLSNFHVCRVEYDGLVFGSTEAAYMYAKVPKTPELETLRQSFVNMTPSEARKLGQVVPLVQNWDNTRLSVMYDVNYAKYTGNPDLLAQLLLLKDCNLVEANWWNDTFWGECRGVGENNLGKTLMKLCADLSNENQ